MQAVKLISVTFVNIPSITIHFNSLPWPVTMTAMVTKALRRVHTPLTLKYRTFRTDTAFLAFRVEAG